MTKPPPGSLIDWTHPLARGLAAAWVLNEGAGGRVNDAASLSYGTLAGAASWQGGDRGSALDFTGASADRVTLSGVPTGGTFTLLARFYQRSQSGYRSIYVDNSGNTGLWLNGGKVDYFQGSDRWPPGAAVVSANTWHTALVITPGAGQNLTYYLDGQLYGTYTNPGGYTPALPSTGNLASHGGEALDGRIGLVYVWLRALSAAEALAVSAAPYGMFANLPAWRRTVPAGGVGAAVRLPPLYAVRAALGAGRAARGAARHRALFQWPAFPGPALAVRARSAAAAPRRRGNLYVQATTSANPTLRLRPLRVGARFAAGGSAPRPHSAWARLGAALVYGPVVGSRIFGSFIGRVRKP